MPSPIYGPWLKDGVRKQMRLNLSTHMDYLEGDLFADRSYFVHEEFVFRPQLCMLGKDINNVYIGLALFWIMSLVFFLSFTLEKLLQPPFLYFVFCLLVWLVLVDDRKSS